jgi:hypothetical protein
MLKCTPTQHNNKNIKVIYIMTISNVIIFKQIFWNQSISSISPSPDSEFGMSENAKIWLAWVCSFIHSSLFIKHALSITLVSYCCCSKVLPLNYLKQLKFISLNFWGQQPEMTLIRLKLRYQHAWFIFWRM